MPPVHSTLEIYDLPLRQRRVLCTLPRHIEAPNWSRDGQFLVVNGDGLLFRVPLAAPALQPIPTGSARRCNNDHGISLDGQTLVISHHDTPDGESILSLLPIAGLQAGGTPERVTAQAPSYWHGWSPDGRWLAFVAGRPAHADFKVYQLDLQTREEKQLSFGPGLDDGPEYSPCGRYLYFNAFRAGRMQIWRMDADGQNPQQLVHSECSDWFPHPSPDGQHLLFLRYLQDQGQGHPFGQSVQLMLLNLHSGVLTELTEPFYGGQGTLNVPCWAPDSRAFAFVSYRNPDSQP